jgi:hypothetical protein
MDPNKLNLQATKQALSESGFSIETEVIPDEAHFGNWILIALKSTLAVRVTSDRGDMVLDLMPSRSFREGATEQDWYTWDVVMRALHLQPKSPDPLMSFLTYFRAFELAFAPIRWKETLRDLRDTEGEKRRRFMEGRHMRT